MTIFNGVLPAITTPFDERGEIDHDFVSRHVRWLVEYGATGIVPHGSLGEGSTLTFDEKSTLQRTCVAALGGRGAVIPGIAALSTAEAVALAQTAEENGCAGLMVLPPYLYASDWREIKAHLSAVIRATALPVMLYNNPVAYRTDFVPEQVAELAAEHPNLLAIKESSTDVRRITALKALLGDRLALGVGVDDVLVEGVEAGATFWVAGLVSAFPAESVALFNLAREGGSRAAFNLYHWFLPLLRLDTVLKFVQLIKLAQAETGTGTERVRPPRLPLTGAEREEALAVIRQALATRNAAVATGDRP